MFKNLNTIYKIIMIQKLKKNKFIIFPPFLVFIFVFFFLNYNNGFSNKSSIVLSIKPPKDYYETFLKKNLYYYNTNNIYCADLNILKQKTIEKFSLSKSKLNIDDGFLYDLYQISGLVDKLCKSESNLNSLAFSLEEFNKNVATLIYLEAKQLKFKNFILTNYKVNQNYLSESYITLSFQNLQNLEDAKEILKGILDNVNKNLILAEERFKDRKVYNNVEYDLYSFKKENHYSFLSIIIISIIASSIVFIITYFKKEIIRLF